MNSADEDILAKARRILEEEGKAILRRSSRLDGSFAELVRRILEVRGHVTITGVGKSGIIGEKIAATLSSTGTPAFFLRPVEAMHGDLGRVSEQDILLAISASGETAEVLAVVQAAKALGVQIVAVTGTPESSLSRAADLTLDVGVEREACPLGLAPTASTTVTLAVGDALAMVLLEARGFTRENYLKFHPGGSLGERLRFCVRDLMRQADRIPRVLESATLADALQEMTVRENIGMTLVVSQEGRLTGILTDGDIRRILLRRSAEDGTVSPGTVTPGTVTPGTVTPGTVEVLQERVARFMSRKPRIVDPESSAAEALRIMEVHGITCLAVVNHQDEPEGVVHLHDILGRGKFLL